MTMMMLSLGVEMRSHTRNSRRWQQELKDPKGRGMVGACGTLVDRFAADAARQRREDVQPI